MAKVQKCFLKANANATNFSTFIKINLRNLWNYNYINFQNWLVEIESGLWKIGCIVWIAKIVCSIIEAIFYVNFVNKQFLLSRKKGNKPNAMFILFDLIRQLPAHEMGKNVEEVSSSTKPSV